MAKESTNLKGLYFFCTFVFNQKVVFFIATTHTQTVRKSILKIG